MALIQSKGFGDADEYEDLDPVEFEVSWRLKKDRSKKGVETFSCVDMIPIGMLADVEGGAPGAGYELLIKSILDSDHEVDKDGEPIEGTSSLERYQTLTHDPTKETPAAEIREILQGLYAEYTARRNPAAAGVRPTTPSGPSSGRSSQTGPSSTAGRSRKASTSGRARRTVA